jgi:hypothetical protein
MWMRQLMPSEVISAVLAEVPAPVTGTDRPQMQPASRP